MIARAAASLCFWKACDIMNAANPDLKDGTDPESDLHEPSIAEILASIRRLIADGQAFSASDEDAPKDAPRPPADSQDAGSVLRQAGSGETGRPIVSGAAGESVATAFNMLLASRFARHSDVVIDLTRDMLRPMLKAWLDRNLPLIVERLVSAEIERLARSE